MSESRTFHLPGRHDQRTHGRRGPGYDQSASWTGQATVRRYGDIHERDRIEEYLFGRSLDDTTWANLSGAPDNARVGVDYQAYGGYDDEAYVVMNVSLPGNHRSTHFMVERDYRGLMISHTHFFLEPGVASRGLGFRGVDRIFRTAQSVGIDRVSAEAVGNASDRNTGYFSWPRMGFDALLSPWRRAELPDSLSSARRLSDLMRTPEGQAWWKRNGSTINVEFDLSPGSRSWEIYNEWKRRVDRVEARRADEPQAFHLPGAHDQRTHGRRGPGYDRSASWTGDVQIKYVDPYGYPRGSGSVAETERKLFGKSLSREEWARLSGAPDGATLQLNHRTWGGYAIVHARVKDPSIPDLDAYFDVAKERGARTARINGVGLFLETGAAAAQGRGFRAVSRVIETAASLGIRSIDISAVGRRHDHSTGYFTWPRMGFDGPLDEYTRATLRESGPPGMKGARRVSALMESPAGQAWWKEHGGPISLSFDLRPGSRSWKLYGEWKKRIDRIEERAGLGAGPRGYSERVAQLAAGLASRPAENGYLAGRARAVLGRLAELELSQGPEALVDELVAAAGFAELPGWVRDALATAEYLKEQERGE